MSGVVAQCDRCAVGRADAAQGTDDQKLRPAQMRRIPPHAGILAEGKDVATGRRDHSLFVEWQGTGWSPGTGTHGVHIATGSHADGIVENVMDVDSVRHGRIQSILASPIHSRSARVKTKNATLTSPFIVIKAVFTCVRSSGLTR